MSLSFGGAALFENVDLALAPGQRACLVGRNGSGKSTLLALLSGAMAPHSGVRTVAPGLRIGTLEQNPVLDPAQTVAGYIGAGETAEHRGAAPRVAEHRVADVAGRLDLAPEARLATLSGGERRRAGLGRVLVQEPDVLLLDEPTNHLDLPTILWLEGLLAAHRGGLLVISHDRAFLAAVTNHMYWLDGGTVTNRGDGFGKFDEWQEQVEQERTATQRKLTQALKAEEHWLVHGVTARRRRNQGRLQKLYDLREARRRVLAGNRSMTLEAGAATASGKVAIDADGISKSYGDRAIVSSFSTRILRGDRIGIIGANGSGKTTLINLLTGRLAPDTGTVTPGSRLEIATFEQQTGDEQSGFDPEETLWRTLVPGGGDSLMVQGRQRHVVSYLREFLFDERQATAPVKTLSGGERNRLKLAQILARPSNMMVLDEPTNDLDADTLDMLQDMLAAYDGTVLLVSHDRDFLDQTVSSIIALDGSGAVVESVGGFADSGLSAKAKPRAARSKPAAKPRQVSDAKLTYKETRELASLPDKMEQLNTAKQQLEAVLADPAQHVKGPDGARTLAGKLSDVTNALAAAEDRWLALETRREEMEGG